MKNLAFLFVLAFFTVEVYAQSGFEKAQVTFTNNQVADYWVNESNIFKQIDVKKEINQAFEKLDLNSISKIVFEKGTEYVVRDVDVDLNRKSGFTSDPLPPLSVNLVKIKSVLGLLVKGNKSLYYSEVAEIKNFYMYDGNEFEYLVYNNYNQSGKPFEDKTFRRQLFKHLECDGFDKKSINPVRYFKKDLEKLFIMFNTCNGSYIETKVQNLDKLNISVSVLAGVRSLNVNVDTGRPSNIKHSGTAIAPIIGVEGSFKLRMNEFYTRAFYTQINIDFEKQPSSLNDVGIVDQRVGNRANLDGKFIVFNLGYRRYFSQSNRIQFFGGAAYEYLMPIGGQTTYELFDSAPIIKQDFKYDSNFTFNLTFGAVFHSKYGVEASYIFPANVGNKRAGHKNSISGIGLTGFYRF